MECCCRIRQPSGSSTGRKYHCSPSCTSLSPHHPSSGHYDILYKVEDLSPRNRPAPPAQQDLPVNLQYAATEHYFPSFQLGLADYEIPGASEIVPRTLAWTSSPQFEFIPGPVTPPVAHTVPASMPTPSYAPTPMISPPAPEYFSRHLSLESTPRSAPLHFSQSLNPVPWTRDGPFRASRWNLEADLPVAPSVPYNCQTPTFKK